MVLKKYNVVRKEVYSTNVMDIITLTALAIYFKYGASMYLDSNPLLVVKRCGCLFAECCSCLFFKYSGFKVYPP